MTWEEFGKETVDKMNQREPVYEKGYPSYEAVNGDNERYYTYMIRRMREEDEKMRAKLPPSTEQKVFQALERIEEKLDKLLSEKEG